MHTTSKAKLRNGESLAVAEEASGGGAVQRPQMPPLSLNPHRVFSTDASSFTVCPWAHFRDFGGVCSFPETLNRGLKLILPIPWGDGLAQLIRPPAGSWSPTDCSSSTCSAMLTGSASQGSCEGYTASLLRSQYILIVG